MKKTLSLILALLMSVSCAVTIFADDDAAIAEDATTEATEAIAEEAVEEEPAEPATPYDRAITFLTTYNIMHGKEDGLLHAEDTVKRYEMALFEGRITTGWVKDDSWEDFQANDSGFPDLAGTGAENVYGAMSYVSQKGIIEGYPDGTFKPEQTVTYREALTMTVRALGYTGLEYPWGYIEEAVKRGLTDGIEGVAYTDPCNRGVAAQIIYNALFADNSKLGLANFDRAFGWADILVTSTVVNDTTEDKDGKDVRATYTSASYATPVKYVAFQIIEKDGTLSKDIYYVPSTEMGLDKGHDDELALGRPYSALFEIDADDNLVELVAIEEYAPKTVKNEGRTDNEGVAYTTVDNITEELKTYTLVDKYNDKILTNAGKLANELIVTTPATTSKIVKFDYSKTPYAFDWTTGDILVAANKDGKPGDIKGDYAVYTKEEAAKVDGAEEGDYKAYVVKYYYNDQYDYYFSIVTKDYSYEDGTPAILGINVLDEKEVADIKAAIDKACAYEEEISDLRYINANIGTAIYATLTTYDTDGDGLAERGNYESYSYGYLSQKTGDSGIKCPKCDAWRDAVAINGGKLGILEIANGKSQDCGGDKHIDGIWWQDEYAPLLDEDGKIVGSYVIYGYNAVTKELKVIKTIEKYSDKLTDADTYYATGILRGYSITNKYVVIGETKIPFNTDFGSFNITADEVIVGGEVKSFKDGAYKGYLSDRFDGLFNEYVRYYVLDGKLVEMETVNESGNDYLVVESCAGISSDGYIVINGYSTKDLKLDRYRIAVYDAWNTGDYFWYGTVNFNQVVNSMTKGNVYKITSYDPDEDVYFVDVMGTVENGEVVINTKADTATITFETGYRQYTVKDTLLKTKKTTSDDKYIIVGQGKDGYMPIAVYEGKVTDDRWTVTGQVLVGDKDATTFVIVNATNVVGFNADAWTNAGLVMVLDYVVMDKFYDGAGVDPEDWYLNGATEYGDIVVFDFLTGKFNAVESATNIKPVEGKVYKTIDNVIVEEITANWGLSVWPTLCTTYGDYDSTNISATATSDYVFDPAVKMSRDYLVDGKEKALSKNEVRNIFGITAAATDLVNSITVVELEYNKDGTIKTISAYTKDDWDKAVKGTDVYEVLAYAVYGIRDDGTVDAVLYIDPDTSYVVKTAEESVKTTSANYIKISEGADGKMNAAITANVVSDKTETMVGTKVVGTEYTINSLGLEFIGAAVEKENHSTIALNGWCFDTDDRCIISHDDWGMTITLGAKNTAGQLVFNTTGSDVYGQTINYTLYDYANKDLKADCDVVDCELIKAFDAAVSGITVTDANTQDNAVYVELKATFPTNLGIGGQNEELVLTFALYVDAKDELVLKFSTKIDTANVNELGGVGLDILFEDVK